MYFGARASGTVEGELGTFKRTIRDVAAVHSPVWLGGRHYLTVIMVPVEQQSTQPCTDKKAMLGLLNSIVVAQKIFCFGRNLNILHNVQQSLECG